MKKLFVVLVMLLLLIPMTVSASGKDWWITASLECWHSSFRNDKA